MMDSPLNLFPRESPVVFMISINQGEDLMDVLGGGTRQITSGKDYE